jgi:hypothetical protein
MKLAQSILCGAAALCFAGGAFAQANSPSGSGSTPSPSAGPGAAPSGSASSSSGSSTKRGMQLKQGQSRQQLFQSLDTNGDGQISKAEADASPALLLIFPDTDANSDGAVTVIEFEAVPLTNSDGTPAQ